MPEPAVILRETPDPEIPAPSTDAAATPSEVGDVSAIVVSKVQIPSQTLFGERTPEGLMGRVIAIRTSIVMGALTGAMAVSAILADFVDAGVIIAATGVITLIAAGVAALLPAVRDA